MKKPKIIAFYLPQFHEIPENNKWWGKGFTEWTNVKKAKPLFKGHNQPRVPYKNNYYNLLDPKIGIWQAKLAKKYGIYGFCYYHYWFKGKKLLEKPVEEILRLKTPNLPFCFSWANESWSRTWYDNNREILMKQDYGTKKDWKKHFEYLLKFFKDKRYIKVDNKPLFLIYKPTQINKLDSMIEYWNYLAKKEGFSGIHIVETLTSSQQKPNFKYSEGIVFYEPGYTICNHSLLKRIKLKVKSKINRILENKYLLNRIDYDKIYREIIKRNLSNFKKKVYIGSFVDYDDISRKKYQGFIFDNVTPEKFENYLRQLLKKSQESGSEFVFLTAWNEWAEGAYLEPDKKNKYNFLNSVKNAQDFKNI
ncbi:MAG: glycoside hydrolase family 99-like domain-containing protein [Candidatus Pacearchaeota archaeon]